MHPFRSRFALLRLALVALAVAAFSFSVPAVAATPSPSAGETPPPRSSNGGVINGLVESVDYQRGILAVNARGKKMEVTVLPSTSIQGPGGGYHSIAEITRGAQVQIFTSVAEGKWTAQIIKLMH
jgi:hypothetical protein